MVSEPPSSLLNREPDPPSSPESGVLAHWSYPILIGLSQTVPLSLNFSVKTESWVKVETTLSVGQ